MKRKSHKNVVRTLRKTTQNQINSIQDEPHKSLVARMTEAATHITVEYMQDDDDNKNRGKMVVFCQFEDVIFPWNEMTRTDQMATSSVAELSEQDQFLMRRLENEILRLLDTSAMYGGVGITSRQNTTSEIQEILERFMPTLWKAIEKRVEIHGKERKFVEMKEQVEKEKANMVVIVGGDNPGHTLATFLTSEAGKQRVVQFVHTFQRPDTREMCWQTVMLVLLMGALIHEERSQHYYIGMDDMPNGGLHKLPDVYRTDINE